MLNKAERAEFAKLKAFIEAQDEKAVFAPLDHVKKFQAEGLLFVDETNKDENGNVFVSMFASQLVATPVATAVVAQATASATGTEEFTIETGIEIPVQRVREEGKMQFPFDKMEIGQSFFVKAGYKNKTGNDLAKLVNGALSSYLKHFAVDSGKVRETKSGKIQSLKLYTRKYLIRKDASGGVRVWRVEGDAVPTPAPEGWPASTPATPSAPSAQIA